MNEEERRRHKERRKRQKKRRNERKREEAKQARIADHQKRIEAEVDRVVQKCIERGELVRVRAGQSREQKAGANDEPRGPARPVNNEGETSRKRVSQSRPSEDVPRKAARTSPHIKEISSYRVTLTEKHVGSGSYGSCYLGDFRGLKVVVKTLRVRQMQGESVGDAEKRVRNELLYEARIITKLGDHPGLPPIYDVCSQMQPFRLVIQFHGDKRDNSSLTISSVLSRKMRISKAHWFEIIANIARALQHVHKVGFVHNDIKANNVVLDRVDATLTRCNPVLIDFGKSLPLTGLQGPKVMSEKQQIKYTKDFPHIAPEIVTGKKGQSIESDIYSFGKMTDVIFLKANLGSLHEVLRQTLDVDPKKRPTLQEILKQLLKSEAPVRKLPH